MSELLKCGKCEHYHFGVTKEVVDQMTSSFSRWANTLSQDYLDKHYDGSVPEAASYDRCFSCGASYTEMISDDGKCPTGVTLQGIRRA